MKYKRKKSALLLLAAIMIICIGCTSGEFEITTGTDSEQKITEESVVNFDTTTLPDTTVSPDTSVLPDTTVVPETTLIPETTATPETTIPEEIHSNLYDPDLSVEDAIRFFAEVCLDAEYVHSGDPSFLQKWTIPIYYSIAGTPTEKDKEVIDETARTLNSIEGFPGMYPSSDINPINMQIYFCPESDFAPLTGYQSNGNDGFVTFWYNGFNEIYSSVICVRNDIDQELRNSVIMEEIYNGLGPIQDTKLREDSIIFSGFSAPQAMTNTDLLILRLLYHPKLVCGMNADECARIISQLYY
ncbi:MAG: DUF2927 domain-containing protein [Clostridia bacterium]|nr:DUF2927 domain-containing protein [Clostridia bacterium]